MIVAHSIADLVKNRDAWIRSGERIGFVPTMGYLHEGHLSLVRRARAASTRVVASIFVNPKQFDNPEDLLKYPRDVERDCRMLEAGGVDLAFIPGAGEMYGRGFETTVSLGELTRLHEGSSRPGHFDGVATVVSILFNLVRPHCAVFGEKDFQQLRIIERMTADLHFGIEIIRAPLVREPDGLAMSSRNVRLSADARAASLLIYKGIERARALFRSGERRSTMLRKEVEASIAESPLMSVEYVHLVDEELLQDRLEADSNSRLLIAVQVIGMQAGAVRLIDTARIGE